MKFIIYLCTILLVAITGVAAPLAELESPALKERQSNTVICSIIAAIQNMSFPEDLDPLSHASTSIPGFVELLKEESTTRTLSVHHAVAKAFTQAKANHVSTSFLELQLARSSSVRWQ